MKNMTKERNKTLYGMLEVIMAGYRKPAPDKGEFDAWVKFLQAFSLENIQKALFAYTMKNTDFPPTPVAIAKLCREMDGRPTAEEAWAIARPAYDESVTVVWTTETREAFLEVRQIIEESGDTAARLAFRDIYNRLVFEARAAGKPTEWVTSLGFDKQLRKCTIEEATAKGLITCERANLLIADESGIDPSQLDEKSREKALMILSKIRESLAGNDDRNAKKREAERAKLQMKKDEVAEKVLSYKKEAA